MIDHWTYHLMNFSFSLFALGGFALFVRMIWLTFTSKYRPFGE